MIRLLILVLVLSGCAGPSDKPVTPPPLRPTTPEPTNVQPMNVPPSMIYPPGWKPATKIPIVSATILRVSMTGTTPADPPPVFAPGFIGTILPGLGESTNDRGQLEAAPALGGPWHQINGPDGTNGLTVRTNGLTYYVLPPDTNPNQIFRLRVVR